MIKDTPFNRILIRLSILAFRVITPVATVISIGSLIGLALPSHFFAPSFGANGISTLSVTKAILAVVFVLTVPEPLFYILVYVPRLRYLQKHTIPPEGSDLKRTERRELVRKLLEEVDDVKFWTEMWCCGGGECEGRASKSTVQEWLAWGILNRYSLNAANEDEVEELDEYLSLVEQRLSRGGIVLEDGSNGRRNLGRGRKVKETIRVTIDPMRVLHRPLLYYIFGVGFIDSMLFAKMWNMGFQHLPVTNNFQSFPWRPLSMLAKQGSPTDGLNYWYREHTSKTRLPILYIHGIGVGLITYTDFFSEIIAKDSELLDGQVGIVAIEVMPISFRLTAPIPASKVLAEQIRQILHRHGWDKTKFVLAANSYGTIISTYLLRSPTIAPFIGPMVLIDPVTLWAHMGDVAYNFTVRQPKSASEWQLWYFACTDMMAAHTVTRRFTWRENVLWRDEIAAKKVAIVLSGSDIILDAKRLRRFLVGDQEGVDLEGIEGGEIVRTNQEDGSRDLELLWFKDLNHAEVFEQKKERHLLVDTVWRYCLKEPDS